MRDLQTSAALVVGRGRTLLGTVRDRDVMRQVKAGETDLMAVTEPVPSVTGDVALADLYEASVESPLPIAVVDENNRLIGVIPRVTLLAAVGNVSTNTGETPAVEPPSTIPINIISETLRVSALSAAAAAEEQAAEKEIAL
jgi:glycine betaine/proline transport system ATP-binding protein